MRMRTWTLTVSLILSIFCAGEIAAKSSSAARGTGLKSASTQVRGHTTKSGHYVAPHRRTTPDKSEKNNYSAKGNVNPANGKVGKRTPKH